MRVPKHPIAQEEGYQDRSPKGVALRLGLSPRTIYNYMERGELKARKVGTRTIITEQDEQEWLDSLPPAYPKASNA